MCIQFVYFTNSPSSDDAFQVIIANNRDEFLKRPTKAADFWHSNVDCLSGIDLQAGGTWFGVSKKGRIGSLLNILGPLDHTKNTRGSLVKDFIKHNTDTTSYLRTVASNYDKYNPFNLVLLERSQQTGWSLHHVSCTENEEVLQMTKSEKNNHTQPLGVHGFCNLSPGVHGYCNSSPLKPFKKTTYGTNRFSQIVAKLNKISSANELKDELFSLMADNALHLPDDQFMSQSIGSNHEGDHEGLARVFASVPSKEFGTRTTTLCLVDRFGHCEYIEKTLENIAHQATPELWKTRTFNFIFDSQTHSNL